MWVCRCDCGRQSVVEGYLLRKGLTQSCGCLMNEWRHHAFHGTHGMHGSRLYGIWGGMLDRCNRPGNKHYADYCGRGIRVCVAWAESFEAFMAWALESGYQDDLTIERVDVDGNYEPSNCRWATRKEQMRNQRRTRFLTYQGETRSLGEWAELTGISYSLISGRSYRGWSAERIFSEPVHTDCRNNRRRNKQ